MIKVIAAVCVTLTAMDPASAKEVGKGYSAEEMLKLCEGEVEDMSLDFQNLTCTFRLQGVVEMMIMNCSSVVDGMDPDRGLSAGKPPSMGAMRQAYVNYMKDHPEVWGRPWFEVVAGAASETFPCPY